MCVCLYVLRLKICVYVILAQDCDFLVEHDFPLYKRTFWAALTMFGRLPRPTCCQDTLLLLESSFKREYSSERPEKNVETDHQSPALGWLEGYEGIWTPWWHLQYRLVTPRTCLIFKTAREAAAFSITGILPINISREIKGSLVCIVPGSNSSP